MGYSCGRASTSMILFRLVICCTETVYRTKIKYKSVAPPRTAVKTSQNIHTMPHHTSTVPTSSCGRSSSVHVRQPFPILDTFRFYVQPCHRFNVQNMQRSAPLISVKATKHNKFAPIRTHCVPADRRWAVAGEGPDGEFFQCCDQLLYQQLHRYIPVSYTIICPVHVLPAQPPKR